MTIYDRNLPIIINLYQLQIGFPSGLVVVKFNGLIIHLYSRLFIGIICRRLYVSYGIS